MDALQYWTPNNNCCKNNNSVVICGRHVRAMFVCSAWAKPRFSRNAKSSQNGKRDTFCTMRIWLHPKACFVHSSSFVMYVIILSCVSYVYFSLNTTRKPCYPPSLVLGNNYSPTDSSTNVLIILRHLLVIALLIYYIIYYVMDSHTICLVDITLWF